MKPRTWVARAVINDTIIAACQGQTKQEALRGLPFFVMRWAEGLGNAQLANFAWQGCTKVCTFTAKAPHSFISA